MAIPIGYLIVGMLGRNYALLSLPYLMYWANMPVVVRAYPKKCAILRYSVGQSGTTGEPEPTTPLGTCEGSLSFRQRQPFLHHGSSYPAILKEQGNKVNSGSGLQQVTCR